MRTEYRVRVGVRERWVSANDERDAMAIAAMLDKDNESRSMEYVKAVVQKRLVSDWREVPRGKRGAR